MVAMPTIMVMNAGNVLKYKTEVICVITDDNISVLFMKRLCNLFSWPDHSHTP